MLVIRKPIYNAQIVDNKGATECIARSYKNGQWRQCKVQLYNLEPLKNINGEVILAEPYLYDPTVNETIHIAKPIISTFDNPLISLDGYQLADINGVVFTYET